MRPSIDDHRLVPPDPDPSPGAASTAPGPMQRLDASRVECDLARWLAAREAGFELEIVEGEGLTMVLSRDLPGPAFNRVHGLDAHPDLLPRVLDRLRAAGLPGWLPMDEAPWAGATPVTTIDFHLASPATILDRAAEDKRVAGLDVRAVRTGEDLGAWADLMVAGSDLGGAPPEAWRRIVPRLARAAGHHLVLARLHDTPVGVGLIGIRRGVGYLRSTNVVREARGLGIQRALIEARARVAAEAGAELVGAGTSPGAAASVRNLVRLGFEQVWSRPTYRFDPAADRFDPAADRLDPAAPDVDATRGPGA